MKDMERQKFEQEWKEVFEHAEISPSDNLWTSIELDLEREDGKRMRRRLFRYKLMAAASTVFAICFAGIGFYYLDSHGDLAVNSTIKNNNTLTNGTHGVAANGLQRSDALGEAQVGDNSLVGTATAPAVSTNVAGTKKFPIERTAGQALLPATRRNAGELPGKQMLPPYNSLAVKLPEKANPQGVAISKRDLMLQNLIDKEPPVFTYRTLPVLINVPKMKLHLSGEQEDPVKIMMARLEKRELELSKVEDNSAPHKGITERLWTSVGLSAGGFYAANSNVNSAAVSVSSMAVSNTDAAVNQSKASGTSYAAGLNVGKKVSERWVLQGGVSYLTQTSVYQSNAVVATNNLTSFRVASLADLNSSKQSTSKTDKLVATSNYSMSSSLQYISIPLQAGYVAVNHAIAIQLNGGISTDLFIQNTITPENSNVAKLTQGRGDNSPYRSLNFSGMFGTEISYRLGQHYRLALTPGFKYSLSSIYKSETGVISNPCTVDVGLRFKYIFQ